MDLRSVLIAVVLILAALALVVFLVQNVDVN